MEIALTYLSSNFSHDTPYILPKNWTISYFSNMLFFFFFFFGLGLSPSSSFSFYLDEASFPTSAKRLHMPSRPILNARRHGACGKGCGVRRSPPPRRALGWTCAPPSQPEVATRAWRSSQCDPNGTDTPPLQIWLLKPSVHHALPPSASFMWTSPVTLEATC